MDSSERSGPYLIWNDDGASTSGSFNEHVLSKAAVAGWLKRCALAAFVILALPPIPYLTGVIWLLSLATGYLAAVAIAMLMVLPLRRVMSGVQQRITVPTHRRLSEWALILTTAHLILLLVADTTTIEYLKPAQPVFMIAGNAALILMAIVWATSLEKARVFIFRTNLNFRPIHIVLSILTAVLIPVHMIGSAAFVTGPLKPVIFAAITAYAVLQTLRTNVRAERTGVIANASEQQGSTEAQS